MNTSPCHDSPRLLTALLVASGAASAHPHVWVTMKSTVVYAPDGTVVGVRHAWTFDDMFSTFATQGLESKKKGEFTREELQPLAKVNVESLKEYDFFTYAKANGKKAVFVDPVDYHLEFNARTSLLTLHFLLPFKAPVKAQTLDFEVFDPSYFVDFALAEKDPAALDGRAGAAAQLTVGKPQEMTTEMAQRLAQIPAGRANSGQQLRGAVRQQDRGEMSLTTRRAGARSSRSSLLAAAASSLLATGRARCGARAIQPIRRAAAAGAAAAGRRPGRLDFRQAGGILLATCRGMHPHRQERRQRGVDACSASRSSTASSTPPAPVTARR